MTDATRNPTWSRDELIVTLDFYLRYRPSIPGKTSKEIADLSDLLGRLAKAVAQEKSQTFRNANGVYMKLMNFRRFDPTYKGKGLERGGKDEEVVWNLFSGNLPALTSAAAAIHAFVDNGIADVPDAPIDPVDEAEAEEGRVLTRVHHYRERDSKIVRTKKNAVLKEAGKLTCDVCSFDFSKTYGKHGEGYIECHHTVAVSSLLPGQKTKIQDLALVCSNCHRMLHRAKPWLSIEQLKQLRHE